MGKLIRGFGESLLEYHKRLYRPLVSVDELANIERENARSKSTPDILRSDD